VRIPNEQKKADTSVIPADVSYTVIQTDARPGIKRILDVHLNRRVSKETLRAIGLELKAQDPGEYLCTLISYYLPNMTTKYDVWGTTNFKPELEVQIRGLSLEEYNAIRNKPWEEGGELIGSWLTFHGRIIICRRDGKIYADIMYKDDSGSSDELIEKETTTGRKFEKKDISPADKEAGTYWLVDKSGILQFHDKDEQFGTCEKYQVPIGNGVRVPVKTATPVGKDLVVSISIEPEVQADKRIIISGKTNLPSETLIFITLEDAITLGNYGGTKATILSDGVYKTEPFGGTLGLPGGKYVAGVTMLLPALQPKTVRQIIGENGQNLKGPLVTPLGGLGNTIRPEKEFRVGGEDGVKDQLRRVTSDLKLFKGYVEVTKSLYSQADKIIMNGGSEDYIQTFKLELRQLRNTLSKIPAKGPTMRARIIMMTPADNVYLMFNCAENNDDKEYREAKADYLSSLKEMEAFLQEYASKINTAERK